MKKVLILGAEGMLGKVLIDEFSNFEVIGFDKKELDITDEGDIKRIFTREKPEIIINAAEFTDVDKAEVNENLAMKVNGDAVGLLANASSNIDAIFVHISTDYVFDGEDNTGYSENDKPKNPKTIYGKSKLLGENLLIKESKKDLKYYLVRTSWLFGSGGKNFVSTIIDAAKDNSELKIVNDQTGRPTYIKSLSIGIKQLIEKGKKFGIYHITNEPSMTWYEFAKLILETEKEINPNFLIPALIPVNSKEFPRTAERPHWSTLNNTKLPKGQNIKDVLKDHLITCRPLIKNGRQ
jgi:dTDP-4-dehydrorhamnose reductase